MYEGKIHLDGLIVQAVDKVDVTLFVLSSNTILELQQKDKFVLSAFETCWNYELRTIGPDLKKWIFLDTNMHMFLYFFARKPQHARMYLKDLRQKIS